MPTFLFQEIVLFQVEVKFHCWELLPVSCRPGMNKRPSQTRVIQSRPMESVSPSSVRLVVTSIPQFKPRWELLTRSQVKYLLRVFCWRELGNIERVFILILNLFLALLLQNFLSSLILVYFARVAESNYWFRSSDDARVDYTSLLGLEDRRKRFSEELLDTELRDSVQLQKMYRELQRQINCWHRSKVRGVSVRKFSSSLVNKDKSRSRLENSNQIKLFSWPRPMPSLELSVMIAASHQ